MNKPLDFISSKASSSTKKINFETVIFESYKSKSAKDKPIRENKDESAHEKQALNIKQAKQDIIKLGMSGLDSQQKEQAKINLLIKLGAKPPKRKNKNYKQLQVERKKAKDDEAKRLNFSQLGKNQLGKSTAKGKSFDRKRRKGNNIIGDYGKVDLKNK